MHFPIQAYQNTLWALLSLLCLCIAVGVIAGISLASRVMSARMGNTTITLAGRYESKPLPKGAFRTHKRLTIAAVTLTCFMLLFMLTLLPDSRMQVINDDLSDVLTVTGLVDALQPRTLLDGTLPYHAEQGFTFGTAIWVNGRVYHVLSAHGVSVGETVTLQYLPRSRCVVYVGDGSDMPYPAITAEAARAAEAAARADVPPVREMRFPFEDYVRCFTVEVLLFAVFGIILLRTLMLTVISLFRRTLTAQDAITSVIAIFILAHLMTVGCSSVWGGQWRLLLEKPQDAVQVQGTIERIEILGSSEGVKFSTEWGTHFGCRITIGEGEYFAMYEGDLTEGDAVALKYLPMSRCVTSIAPLKEDLTP